MENRDRSHLSPDAIADQDKAREQLKKAGIRGTVGLTDGELGGAVIHVVEEDIDKAQKADPNAKVEPAPRLRNDEW